MSIEPKFVELTANILEIFFIKEMCEGKGCLKKRTALNTRENKTGQGESQHTRLLATKSKKKKMENSTYKGPDQRRARKIVVQFYFFNFIKNTRKNRLCFLSRNGVVCSRIKKAQNGQRTPVGNDRGKRWLASCPELRGQRQIVFAGSG